MVTLTNKAPLIRYPADAPPCLAEALSVIFDAVSFTVPAGFCGESSIPRFFWRIVGAPTTGPNLLAGIIHDYCYSEHLFTRAECDELFYQVLLYLGKSKLEAKLMWAAVRIFGGSHY